MAEMCPVISVVAQEQRARYPEFVHVQIPTQCLNGELWGREDAARDGREFEKEWGCAGGSPSRRLVNDFVSDRLVRASLIHRISLTEPQHGRYHGHTYTHFSSDLAEASPERAHENRVFVKDQSAFSSIAIFSKCCYITVDGYHRHQRPKEYAQPKETARAQVFVALRCNLCVLEPRSCTATSHSILWTKPSVSIHVEGPHVLPTCFTYTSKLPDTFRK